jgi:hypothetical protein
MSGFRPFSVMKSSAYLLVAGTLLVPYASMDVETKDELRDRYKCAPFDIMKLYSIWISSCQKVYLILENFVNPQGFLLVRACG